MKTGNGGAPSKAHGRSAWLLVSALAVLCLVLVLLGIKLIREGEEVARVRQTAERKGQLAQFSVALLARLEQIKARAVHRGSDDADRGAAGSDIAFLAVIRDETLVFPWEMATAQGGGRMEGSGPFAEAISRGERYEHGILLFGAAAAEYARAESVAVGALQVDFARLLRARALFRAGQTANAEQLFRRLLTSGSRDEEGIPLAFYAADRLKTAPADVESLVAALSTALADRTLLSPAAIVFARTLLTAAQARGSSEAGQVRELAVVLAAAEADLNRALALQRSMPRALVQAGQTVGEHAPTWICSADRDWLLSVAPAPAGGLPVVLAVRSGAALASALATLRSSDDAAAPVFPRVQIARDTISGEEAGEALPGVRLTVAETNDDWIVAWRRQRAFYVAALLTIVFMTVGGAVFVLRDLRRELRLADLRSQFVASVSHELRTPLTAIRMFAETMQMNRPLEPSQRTEYLDTIVSESERLTRLVNNVLDFAKIERGEKTYHLEPAALGDIVRSAAAAMRYPLSRLGFDLRLSIADSIPVVRLDRDAIEQAVLNLLSNAVEYSGDRKTIDLSVTQVGDGAVIAVTDYGVGIAPSEQARVFHRYYRVPTAANARIPGAGLGLALVDHIVKAHGGRIELRSVPGEGSTFSMYLPHGPQRGAQA